MGGSHLVLEEIRRTEKLRPALISTLNIFSPVVITGVAKPFI